MAGLILPPLTIFDAVIRRNRRDAASVAADPPSVDDGDRFEETAAQQSKRQAFNQEYGQGAGGGQGQEPA